MNRTIYICQADWCRSSHPTLEKKPLPVRGRLFLFQSYVRDTMQASCWQRYFSRTISENRTMAFFVGRCGWIVPTMPTFWPMRLVKSVCDAKPLGSA